MKTLSRYNRVMTLMAACLITLVFLLSTLYITTHLEHECTGRDCQVCGEIEACAANLRLLSEGIGPALLCVFAVISGRIIISEYFGRFLRPLSLVRLKIRLNN